MPNIKARSNKQFEKIENKIDNFASEAVSAVKNEIDPNSATLVSAISASAVDSVREYLDSDAETLGEALESVITEIAEQVVPVGTESGSLSGDLKDLTYETSSHEETVYALQTGNEYKINFNAINYTDLLNPALQSMYSSSGDNQPDIGNTSCTYYGLKVTFYEDPINYSGLTDYYLQYDLSNPEKLLVWKKGSNSNSDECTQSELANLTLTLHSGGIKSSYDSDAMDALLKAILVNVDGTTITTLTDGNSYKINTNAMAYRNIFDTIHENFDNSGAFYSWTASDSNVCIIQVYSYPYQYTPYISYEINGNSNYFYLIPSVSETYYPGRWANNSYMYTSGIHFYTNQELANIPSFIFNRDNIYNYNPNAESNLHKLLVNADGTPIGNNTTEIVYDYETLNDKISNFKNWIYEKGKLVILDDINWSDLSDVEDNPTTIYEDEENEIRIIVGKMASNIMIQILKGSDTYLITNESLESPSETLSANTWYVTDKDEVNETSKPNFKIEDKFIDPDYIDYFNAIFYHEEDKSIEKIISDLDSKKIKNAIYDQTSGEILNIPDWEKIIELMPDIDYRQIYFDGENSIYLESSTDMSEELYWQISISLDNWESENFYIIYNRNVSFLAKPSPITFNGNTWYSFSNSEETTKPEISLNKQYVYNDENDLFDAVTSKKQTLEEKINNLKNWKYEELQSLLVDEESYSLLEKYSDDMFEKYSDLFTTGVGTLIYSTGTGIEIDLVKLVNGTDEINFILFSDINAPEVCSAYVKYPIASIDGWFEAQWDNNLDGWNLVTPPTPANAPTIDSLSLNSIVNEEVMKDILGLGSASVTLDQKFSQYISLTELKSIVADSSDFADFQSKIANL